jgi:hypothetical protein
VTYSMSDNKAKLQLPTLWQDFLREVDQALRQEVNLHCLGGFVLSALYGLPRPTGDLDYISANPFEARQEIEKIAGLGSRLSKKYKLFVQCVGVADYPEDYEDRLTLLDLGFQNLRLWVLEPYDLILSKLARNNPKDRDDVKFLVTKLSLSFNVLYRRWESEMKPWIANADRHETTINLWKSYFQQ